MTDFGGEKQGKKWTGFRPKFGVIFEVKTGVKIGYFGR